MSDLVRQARLGLRARHAREKGENADDIEKALSEAKARERYENEQARSKMWRNKFSRALRYDLTSKQYPIMKRVFERSIAKAKAERNITDQEVKKLRTPIEKRIQKRYSATKKNYDGKKYKRAHNGATEVSQFQSLMLMLLMSN